MRVAYDSSIDLLVLHGVRIQGMADAASISRRFALDREAVEELLLDFEAQGWVSRAAFADLTGWGLTPAGRDEGARLLAVEVDRAGVGGTVAAAHDAFVQLNERFLRLITRWQIRPTRTDPMAANDHSEWRWDEDIVKSLTGMSRQLRPVGDQLAGALSRFAGYPERFAAALDRVDKGDRTWVDGPRIDSCHTVWFELHEDLLATLGLERGTGA